MKVTLNLALASMVSKSALAGGMPGAQAQEADEVVLGGRPLVVNNLLDAQPPVLAVAAVNTGGNPYDYIGRSFRAGIRLTW